MALDLAILPGDGTGPEVVAEAVKVLEAISKAEKFEYTTKEYDFGGDRYLATGKIIDDEEIAQLQTHDAILLGAVGHPGVKPGILEKASVIRPDISGNTGIKKPFQPIIQFVFI